MGRELIMRQIAAAHGGSVAFRHSEYGGFEAEIELPLQQEERSDEKEKTLCGGISAT